MRILPSQFLVCALMVTTMPPAALSQDAALEGAIRRELARHRTADTSPELGDVSMSDLDGDGTLEAVASFTVFGPSSGWVGVLVMAKRGARWASAGEAQLGQGKVVGIRNRVIEVEALTLGPNDARCCPSVKQERRFALRAGRLIEVAGRSAAGAPGGAPAQGPEVASTPFRVEVRSVRAGNAGAGREVVAFLRFTSTVDRPVSLAYELNSPALSDDRGNRYANDRTYGLGSRTPARLDAWFTLAPRRSADALLHFTWGGGANRLFGLEYGMQLPVREWNPTPDGRFAPGNEHVIEFSGLKDGASSPAPGAPALSDDTCAGRPACSAADGLVTRLTTAATSMWGNVPYTRLSVRFHNTSTAPLVLCLVSRSPSGMDDRGNQYALHREGSDGVRGIPLCPSGEGYDASFAIAPNGNRDAVLEYNYNGVQRAIRGTKAQFDFAVRQVTLLPGDQAQRGREIPVLFRDVPLQAGEPSATADQPPDGARREQPDSCANLSNCYAAGPFTVQLTSVVASRETGYRYLRLGVRVRNLTTDRLVLCFTSTSGVASDENQNRYAIREDIGVRGLGLCQGQTVSPQFVIGPNATRDANLEFNAGIYTGNELWGSSFAINFALDQIALLPGNQVQKVGQWALTFDGVKASDGSGAKPRGLMDKLRSAVKKP